MIQKYRNFRCLNLDYEDDEYGDADNWGFGWGGIDPSDKDDEK